MPTQTRAQSAGEMKWIVAGFAFSATVINYLDRQTLSVLAPILLQRYRITPEAYSHIIFAFMLAYTISNGVSGRLLDRAGSKLGYAVCIALWSGAEMLHALARGALSFGVFRFLLGIGEAGNYPAGVKVISECFPEEQRSLACGIFNSGASIGAILAPPLLAWIAITLGVGKAFLLIGSLGFLWLGGWLLLYRKRDTEPEVKVATVPLKSLLKSKFLWLFTISKVFSDPVWYFYTFWFPQYLRTAFGYSIREIGATAWIPFLTAAIGNMAGGLVFLLLRRIGLSLRSGRRASIVAFSLLMVSAVAIRFCHSPAACIALISTATFGYSGALANLLALPADVYPQGAVASVWGFASVGAGFGGMLFAEITGWIVQHDSFSPTFLLFGTIPILSIVMICMLPKTAGVTGIPTQQRRS